MDPARYDSELTYLTVDQVQWSKGYMRPRMNASESKARHRLVQQQFVERKRQRVRELRHLVGLLELQLLLLTAEKEAHELAQENNTMRVLITVNELVLDGAFELRDDDGLGFSQGAGACGRPLAGPARAQSSKNAMAGKSG